MLNEKQLTLLLDYIDNEIAWVSGHPSHTLYVRTETKRENLRKQLFETLSKQDDEEQEHD